MLGYKIRSGLTSGITNCSAETYTEEGWLGKGRREVAKNKQTKKTERSNDRICTMK